MADTPELSLESLVVRGQDVIAAEMEEHLAMMRIERNSYYTLDRIGADVWKLLERPRTVSSVCDTLLECYAVPREQCEKDVLAFLRKMLEEGLIRVPSSDAG